MTRVINIKEAPISFQKKDGDQDGFVYIGRPFTFGNPILKYVNCIICGKVHTTNGSTLVCYEKYLRTRIFSDEDFKLKVKSLLGKTLVCYCKPKKCHGDILKKVTEELNFEDIF